LKYLQKLINGHIEDQRSVKALYNDEFYIYYSSKHFYIGELLDELFELEDLIDKILLLKFISREVNKEIDDCIGNIKICKRLIKKKGNFSENVTKINKEIVTKLNKEELKNYILSKEVLEEHRETLSKELGEYTALLKASGRKQNDTELDEVIAEEQGKNLRFPKSMTKIRWTGTETQFVYLFEQLVKVGLLNDDFFDTTGGGYALMAKYFENRQGKQFKNTQLTNTSQNLGANKKTPGKPKGADKIDKVISETKRKK